MHLWCIFINAFLSSNLKTQITHKIRYLVIYRTISVAFRTQTSFTFMTSDMNKIGWVTKYCWNSVWRVFMGGRCSDFNQCLYNLISFDMQHEMKRDVLGYGRSKEIWMQEIRQDETRQELRQDTRIETRPQRSDETQEIWWNMSDQTRQDIR